MPANDYSFDELLSLHLEQSSKKKSPAYGLKLIKSLWTTTGGDDGYFTRRNQQFKSNADLVKGIMDSKIFREQMGISETGQTWTTVDMKLMKIIPRYFHNMVGGFMNREEKPSVSAVDILSRQMRDYEKELAKFRMQNKAQIEMMEAAGGVPLMDGFVPEDEDELELYYKLQYRMPEEAMFENGAWEVLQNSDYDDLKRQLLSDLVRDNMAMTKIVRHNMKGRSAGNSMYVRRCKPARSRYNVFESPVGKDVTLIGEEYLLSVADIRRYFPKVGEDKLFELAQIADRRGSGFSRFSWDSRYEDGNKARPYDEIKIPVFDFEVRLLDKDYYVQKTTTEYNRPVLDKKGGKPMQDPKDGKVLEDIGYNLYCGIWAVDTEVMLKWELAPNQIKPYQNGQDCFHTYSIVIPDNDGTLAPSKVEIVYTVIRKLLTVVMKLDQMVIEMVPDGIMFDIGNMHDLNIGTGAALKPLEIKRIYKQTGDVLYNSTDTSGAGLEGNGPPINRIQNGGNVAQINALIAAYNFYLDRLNDEWGTNNDALGAPVPARRSNKVNENQIQAANLSLEYIYDYYIALVNQNAQKIVMLLWDELVFQAGNYKKMDGIHEQLIDMKFDTNIEMVPITEDKQWLEQMIGISLERQTITPGQATRIRNMKNVKDAEMYLLKMEKQQEQKMQQAKQQDYENNAQLQQTSAQAKAEADNAVNQGKAQAEAMVNDARLSKEGFNKLIDFVSALQIESMKLGVPINPQWQPMIDYVITTTIQSAPPPPDEQPAEEQPQEEMMEPQPEMAM